MQKKEQEKQMAALKHHWDVSIFLNYNKQYLLFLMTFFSLAKRTAGSSTTNGNVSPILVNKTTIIKNTSQSLIVVNRNTGLI